jgi:IclR family acetate operon transcriptional repressor
VQAVDRIVAILATIVPTTGGLTLSEVARSVELTPATTHRLLQSLMEKGLIERDPLSRRYRSGVGLIQMAAAVLATRGAQHSVDLALGELRDQWRECFFLAMLTDDSVLCLRSVEPVGSSEVSFYVRLGTKLPPHSSAAAKTIAAFGDQARIDRLVGPGPFERYTQFTLTEREEVLVELEKTREAGYGICDQEMEIAVAAVAVPILVSNDAPVRAIGAIAPRERLMEKISDGLVDAMTQAAARLAAVESIRAA